MLEPIKHYLNSKIIVLASASPRRKEILQGNLGLNIKIVPSKFAEDLDKSLFPTPADYVLENSRLKAIDVAQSITDKSWHIIIGADTVVVKGNKIYEKPVDKQDAFNILKDSHKVLTGVTLLKNGNIDDLKTHSFYESAEVRFGDLPDNVIWKYIETGEPMDKAGGYGIQALGSSLVQSINGDYFNVEGFPVYKFCVELKKFLELPE